MACKNENLAKAKREKNDEFYTLLTDIEKEMKHHKEQFKDKVVYCNCDDARQSNFFKYFSMNFEHLGLKKLITTSYNADGNGTILVYEGDKNGNRKVDDEEVQVSELNGNGDFRSEECLELLKQADIVVTNPPFSLFRDYVSVLFEYDKKFCVIGNINAITYKEVFPYIMQGKVWFGRSTFNNGVYFNVPKDYEYSNTYKFKREKEGKKVMRVPSICWFTNMENNKKEDVITLIKTYNEEDYPKYDNYNAINCGEITNIPYDYDGVIGVPITVLKYLCSDGFLHFDTPLQKERKKESSESLELQTMLDTLENSNVEQSLTEREFTTESLSNRYKIVDRLNVPFIKANRIFKRVLIQRI